MKRVIKASYNDLEKVYFKLEKPSLRNYRFSGQVDREHGWMYGDIQKLSPYDDADYVWAKVDGNGQFKFIHKGKVIDKMQVHYYDEDDYDSVDEYFNDVIESVAEELVSLNKSIEPRMIHY